MIAATFAWLGFWMVLPFAGFEMLCLGAALYFCVRKLSQRETVVVDEDEIRISVGREKPEKSCTFKRAWASVVMSPPRFRGEPGSLWIRSHGRQVEIGSFLGENDKWSLARALERAIAG